MLRASNSEIDDAEIANLMFRHFCFREGKLEGVFSAFWTDLDRVDQGLVGPGHGFCEWKGRLGPGAAVEEEGGRRHIRKPGTDPHFCLGIRDACTERAHHRQAPTRLMNMTIHLQGIYDDTEDSSQIPFEPRGQPFRGSLANLLPRMQDVYALSNGDAPPFSEPPTPPFYCAHLTPSPIAIGGHRCTDGDAMCAEDVTEKYPRPSSRACVQPRTDPRTTSRSAP